MEGGGLGQHLLPTSLFFRGKWLQSQLFSPSGLGLPRPCHPFAEQLILVLQAIKSELLSEVYLWSLRVPGICSQLGSGKVRPNLASCLPWLLPLTQQGPLQEFSPGGELPGRKGQVGAVPRREAVFTVSAPSLPTPGCGAQMDWGCTKLIPPPPSPVPTSPSEGTVC